MTDTELVTSPGRVVLVEDNSSDALLTRSVLRKADRSIEVTIVDRLSALQELVESSGNPFDCLLIDLSLPDSHGLETVSRVRTLVGHTPIVVLTGQNDDAVGLAALREGAQDFLVKDEITPRVLARSLRYARERAAAEAALVERERFATTVLDSLAASTAVVDATGHVIRVNQPWREAMQAAGGSEQSCGVGADYLAVCDAAGDHAEARAAGDALRRVLDGTTSVATVEYHVERDDDAEDWFALRVTALADGRGAVATHQRITDEVLARRALEQAAVRDALTGLANRALLEEQLGKALASIGRTSSGIVLFFIDVDHFKVINDSLGHAVGDAVLVQVAERLESAVRASDTVARLGGDEFVVLCDNASTEAEVAAIRRRIATAVRPPVDTPAAAEPVAVSLSVGHVVCTDSDADPAMLMSAADSAMYDVKLAGRGGSRRNAVVSRETATRQLQLQRSLVAALADRAIDVHYQPQWTQDGGVVTAVEALARWDHAELGSVAPNEFVAAAEHMGLIGELGELVLRRACSDAAQWAACGSPVPVAVNVSPLQLQDRRFAATVERIVVETGLDPSLLILEVTENALVMAWETAGATLAELRAIGIRTALDDFGTGQSTLALLQSCPFDIVKIDRTFIADVGTGRGDAVVSAMVSLGHALGLQVVAEGVEHAGQRRRLHELGCDNLQGFHLARPMSSAEFREMLPVAVS